MNERKLIEYIPVITGFVIIAGILKAIAFYWVFGIRIIPFLELSECLLMFLDDIILITIVITVEFACLTAFKKDASKKTNTKRVSGAFIAVTCIISTMIIWLGVLLSSSDKAILLAKIFTFFLLSTSGLMYLFDKLKNTQLADSKENFVKLKAIFMGAYFLAIITTWGAIEGFGIKYTYSKDQLFFITTKSNKLYKSTNSVYYIGKTAKYLFLGNRKIDEKTVISNEDILEIKMGHKN